MSFQFHLLRAELGMKLGSGFQKDELVVLPPHKKACHTVKNIEVKVDEFNQMGNQL